MTAIAEQQLMTMVRVFGQLEAMTLELRYTHAMVWLLMGLWAMVSDLRRTMRLLQADIERDADSPEEIDSDDDGNARLLALQVKIEALIEVVRRYGTKGRKIPRTTKSLARRVAHELKSLHADLGRGRLWLMEHDADVSPVLPETFTSAESLIAALRRDVA